MVSLERLHSGEVGFIGALNGGHRLISRLAALGFTPGAPVTMMRNHGTGPLIVSVRGAQIALGRGEAGRIKVYRTEEEHDAL
jgi:ferrous iron transport protein A